MYQSIPKPPTPPPRAIPGHLTRVKFRTEGNLTQNEARPVGHLTFVFKRLSAVGSKRISQFFHSEGEPRSRYPGYRRFFFSRCSDMDTSGMTDTGNRARKTSGTQGTFTDHCSCRFHVGFSFVVVLYSSIVEYAFV